MWSLLSYKLNIKIFNRYCSIYFAQNSDGYYWLQLEFKILLSKTNCLHAYTPYVYPDNLTDIVFNPLIHSKVWRFKYFTLIECTKFYAPMDLSPYN